MRTLACLAMLLAASTAIAEPRHPRAGLLAELQFATGSTRLPAAAGSQLGRIAAWAEENYDGVVVLDGHADRDGRARGSVRLSLRRARLVRDQLINLGVDPNQIIVTAYGTDSRRHSRVTVWGSHESVQQLIGARRNAPVVQWGRDSTKPLSGRRSPTRRR